MPPTVRDLNCKLKSVSFEQGFFAFFDLPREIRNCIYHYLLCETWVRSSRSHRQRNQGHSIQVRDLPHSNLRLVGHQFNDELAKQLPHNVELTMRWRRPRPDRRPSLSSLLIPLRVLPYTRRIEICFWAPAIFYCPHFLDFKEVNCIGRAMESWDLDFTMFPNIQSYCVNIYLFLHQKTICCEGTFHCPELYESDEMMDERFTGANVWRLPEGGAGDWNRFNATADAILLGSYPARSRSFHLPGGHVDEAARKLSEIERWRRDATASLLEDE